jgi:integrase
MEHMPLIKQFTPQNVRTLPDGTWREEDSPLILRVRRQSRSYVIEYSRAGQTTRYLIGRVGEIELGRTSLRDMDKRTDARALARKARAAVTAGGDPHRERMETKRRREVQERAAEFGTVRAICEKYLAAGVKKDGAAMDEASIATARRILQQHVYPEFGSTKPSELERWRINEHLRSIAKRTPIRARHVLSAWRRAFSWAESEGLLKENPLLRLPAPAPNVERSRVLDDAEIRFLWQAMETRRAKRDAEHRRPSTVAHALWVSLLTGARMGAIAGARWSEIREEQRGEWWWTVPSSRTKNRRGDHRVYLAPMAKAILIDVMKPITGNCEHVFHADSKTGSMTTWGPSWSNLLDDARTLARNAGDEHAFSVRTTPHDLRRTCATGVSRLFEDVAASRFYTKLVLGHVDPSVTGIYDRNRHDATRRRVAGAWSARVEEIIEGRSGAAQLIAFQAGA